VAPHRKSEQAETEKQVFTCSVEPNDRNLFLELERQSLIVEGTEGYSDMHALKFSQEAAAILSARHSFRHIQHSAS